LKFKFLKFSSLSGHHIGQGIQSYFCCGERSFAEIYISNLGMVTVSDSNFGSSLSDALVGIFGRSLLVELVHNLVKLN
jgi:hypothetical protein